MLINIIKIVIFIILFLVIRKILIIFLSKKLEKIISEK